ncbi:MAG: Fe-S cluster assembly protein SufD, partial [Chloroflexota bacterium]
IRENGDLLQEFLMKDAVVPESGKFAALHAALLRGGIFLYIPKGISAGMFTYHRRYDRAINSFSHLLVVLEEGAEASLYIDSESVNEKADAFHVGVTEMIVGRNARLNLVHRQNWADNLVNISHEKAIVQQDAVINWSTASFGSSLTKTYQSVDLAGMGAEAWMNGLLFGDERQHIDLETEQNHLVPNTMSDLLYKGALDAHGRSVWRGMIRVLPEAQKTNGYQANRNLLLASTARADSIPGLEIEADDVRRTHGTTVSTVNEDEVFYAMTRGLPRDEAVRLLVRGFYSPVMERVPLETIRRILWDTIDSRISNHSLPTS